MVTDVISQRRLDLWIPVVDRDTYSHINYQQFHNKEFPKVLMRGANFMMMALRSSMAEFYFQRIERYVDWKLKNLTAKEKALLAYKAANKIVNKWGEGNYTTIKAIDLRIQDKTGIYRAYFSRDL